MTNEDIVAKMNEALAGHSGMEKSIKLDLREEGQIFIQGTEAVAEDRDADCTISVAKDDFIAIAKREMNPMGAFMSGRLKVSGDMSVAMGLVNLFK